MSARLTEIVAAIEELSPRERRALLRRLRVSGLLEHETLITDQQRLQIAPALGGTRRASGPRAATAREQVIAQPSSPAEEQSAPPRAAPRFLPTEPAPLVESSRTAQDHDDMTYRSPVSGKIVVGAPGAGQTQDPHAMSPLPGQAPEQPIRIIFDGGSKGNPGRGYGSYALRWPGQSEQIVQLQFGNHVTNNEAEYDTLIAALEAVLKRLADQRADAKSAKLIIHGDSLLVINQVLGSWKCKEARLKVRRDRAQELLGHFSRWQLRHHDRSESVKVLGH